MITVTRLDGGRIVVNAELIESIESVPETVIVLTTKKRVMVRESVDDVVQRVIAYRQAVCRGVGGSAGTAQPSMPVVE